MSEKPQLQNDLNNRISVQNLWKVFGPRAEEVLQESWVESASKEEILNKTDHCIAVKNVSFDVRAGEVFVIMGLSGSGKSTLLRCLNCLIKPTRGKVYVDNESILEADSSKLREIRCKKMSMVFQHFGLFPHRSVIENVVYGLEVQGVDTTTRREAAQNVLKLVGLKGWENYYPQELSGGMQQRVGLARALAVDPEILLFDEPFSALDPLIRSEMQAELINLQKMVQKTIVFITHDFLEAIKLGDRIAILKDGELIQLGNPQEIVMHPATEYVRRFVSDVPRTKVLTSRYLMVEPELCVNQNSTPDRVISRMNAEKIHTAYVIDDEGQFIGVLEYDQLVEPEVDQKKAIGGLVSKQQTTARPDMTLEELLPIAARTQAAIPVVDENQKFAGIISQESVIKAIVGDEE